MATKKKGDYVTVMVTHKDGQKLDKPYKRIFSRRAYNQVKKYKFITTELVKEEDQGTQEPADNLTPAPGIDLTKVATEYERLTGKKPDGRWSVERIQEEIEKLSANKV